MCCLSVAGDINVNMSPCLAGFLSAFCPRGWGFFGEQTHIRVQACGKLGGSRGMLPWENFDFEHFIRRNLVESGSVFAQTKLYN